MFQRTTYIAALAVCGLGLTALHSGAQPEKKAKPEDSAKSKKALQEVQDFIGLWNLEGTQKVGAKTEAWKEKVSWGWKFKDGDAWITVSFAEGKGKYFTSGELKYDAEKKKYLLALTPSAKGEAAQTFEGAYAKGALKVERKDPKTNDVYRLTLNTAAEGERFAMKYEKQDGGKGLFSAVHAMNGSKDGVVAGAPKKPECIVSGGSANISVSYNGKDYWVCCSGCRDEFKENPEKYVKGK
ncbi:YHS domain-containing protein [Gemmata sp. G18]|uniref:YHS domain-containing protein n=1 Tax=Gemmata palustris TaxID=2822762 RepID=A0ABS5BNH3_9BACT|nr:YHS domain-containing protein [Gemmata palustris]MBP3955215.1 YHS domain-containing protein [Gemmata palustris]